MWTMKLFLLSLCVAIMISKTYGYPVAELTAAKNHDSSKYAGVRQRRVTCDLLSFMGDTACAANCLSMGKAGGTCQGGICVCRRDTFEDVWETRFGPIPTFPPPATVKPFVYVPITH